MTLVLGGIAFIISAIAITMQFELSTDQLYYMSLISFGFSLVTLSTEKWALPYVLRLIMLGAPGGVTAYILVHQAYGSKSMNHALPIQYKELATWVSLLTSLALSAHALGWRTGVGVAQRIRLKTQTEPIREDLFRQYFIFFTAIAIVASYIISKSLGFIWEAGYSLDRQDPLYGVGSYNFFITISLIGVFTLFLKTKKVELDYLLVFIATTIYATLFCMLFRGQRAEVVGLFFALTTLYSVHKKIKWNGIQIIGTLICGYLFVLAWGVYRTAAPTGFGLIDSLQYMNEIRVNLRPEGYYMFETGTFGDVAATLYDAIILVQKKTIALMGGRSYLDYFARTLPAFIFPDRPRDLSLLFYDQVISQGGGIFELAEAYFNFAELGCFLMPFLLSFAIGYMHEKSTRTQAFIDFIIVGTLSAAIFRGTLYQTFVFYRVMTILIVMLVFIKTYQWISQSITKQRTELLL